MAEQSFKAYRVSENAGNNFESAIIKRSISELTPSDVLIKVSYSSLNYKDALSASGNKGVTREFPHTPGIDAAGVVVSSKSKNFVFLGSTFTGYASIRSGLRLSTPETA